jgi:hypothetical protein
MKEEQSITNHTIWQLNPRREKNANEANEKKKRVGGRND